MFCVCLNSSKNRTECVQNYIWGNNWDNKNTKTICPRTFGGESNTDCQTIYRLCCGKHTGRYGTCCELNINRCRKTAKNVKSQLWSLRITQNT